MRGSPGRRGMRPTGDDVKRPKENGKTRYGNRTNDPNNDAGYVFRTNAMDRDLGLCWSLSWRNAFYPGIQLVHEMVLKMV